MLVTNLQSSFLLSEVETKTNSWTLKGYNSFWIRSCLWSTTQPLCYPSGRNQNKFRRKQNTPMVTFILHSALCHGVKQMNPNDLPCIQSQRTAGHLCPLWSHLWSQEGLHGGDQRSLGSANAHAHHGSPYPLGHGTLPGLCCASVGSQMSQSSSSSLLPKSAVAPCYKQGY